MGKFENVPAAAVGKDEEGKKVEAGRMQKKDPYLSKPPDSIRLVRLIYSHRPLTLSRIITSNSLQ